MSFRSLRALAVAALLASPLSLQAQVGHMPSRSPFQDVDYRQEITLFSGWYAAGSDPAGVAPRSGPLLGVRYEARVGGPAQFTARLSRVFSERREIDPGEAPATRDLGMQSVGLYLGDVSMSINLTGQKSVQRFVPILNAGVGIVSDMRGRDAGGYRFGTTFAFTYGAGVRWIPRDRWQLRADVADYVYQIQYPDTYYLPTTTGGDDAVLRDTQRSSVWRHNVALTVGASYLFFR